MPKAHAVSKSQLKNIIKITIGDRRKKRKSRRRRARKPKGDAQMELLQALSSKPSMREIQQPKADDSNEKAQNQLITSSLLATNAGIIESLNNLNRPPYSNGRYTTDASLLPQTEEDTAPPETPAGKYAAKVRVARQFLMNNLESIPTKRKYVAGDVMDMAPTFVMNLLTRTRNNMGLSAVGGLFQGEGEDDE